MPSLDADNLHFRFPMDPYATLQLNFCPTVRAPDTETVYRQPWLAGSEYEVLPIRHVEDYADKLPEDVVARGGVLIPLWPEQTFTIMLSLKTSYQPENFEAERNNVRPILPMAVKVGAGKVNVISGKPWAADLTRDPQDYLTVTDDERLDGFVVGENLVRQFVGMPLGAGYTAEEQISSNAGNPEAKFWGGMQICVFPIAEALWNARLQIFENRLAYRMRRAAQLTEMRNVSEPGSELENDDQRPTSRAMASSELPPESFRRRRQNQTDIDSFENPGRPINGTNNEASAELEASTRPPGDALLGIAPGGLLRQPIYEDALERYDWDKANSQRLFVTFVDARVWEEITGASPPPAPLVSDHAYTAMGLPELQPTNRYARRLLRTGSHKVVKGGDVLSMLTSVARRYQALNGAEFPHSADVPESYERYPAR